MAEIILTDEQKEVVQNRGGTLLVSAAAGSGKTKVLVDRVLQRVQSEGCDVDDFLMITFTQAAAAELRGKLLARLSELLAQQPEDHRLQKQLSRVYLAQISTVHSFCSVILREYSHLLGLPADFSVSDEQTALRLREKALNDTLDAAYEQAQQQPELQAALNMLGAGRDDRALPDLIYKVYSSLQCYPSVEHRLQELKDSLELSQCDDAGQTLWGQYYIQELNGYAGRCAESMEEMLDKLRRSESLSAYVPLFEENAQLLRQLSGESCWQTLYAMQPDFGRLPQVRKTTEPELKEKAKKLRERIKKGILNYMKKFSLSSQEVLEDLQRSRGPLRGLLLLTEQFSQAYRREKQRRHLLDYNDLEHEALHLLLREDGTPTAAAREIGERYAEIMVDEYQDTNGVQDAIFRAISKDGGNLFFVGDVKQSIYRFRMADPGLFLEKYKSYSDYRTAQDPQPRKILLSDNFRSVEEVLQAANDVFRLTMSERVGGLYYTDAEALRAKKTAATIEQPVELHCIDMDGSAGEEPLSRTEAEAEFVARRIAQMLTDGEQIPGEQGCRPITPGDVAILLRAPSGKAADYMKALERHGIAAVCAEDELFESDEVILLISLLQVIDNPRQDIPLLSLLLSPVLRFSPEELALSHSAHRNAELYEMLERSQKGRALMEQISALRDAASELSMRELLERIDTQLLFRGIFGAGSGGKQRLRHIERFFALADSYDRSGSYGLAGFLRYIEGLKEKNPGSEQEFSGAAVRIMSVHKSKGLEFPVVFLADLSKKFNVSDSRDTVLVDNLLGIGCGVYDEERRLSYPTLAKNAIAHRSRRLSVSEEMRVLYVAMTRAKYRLIMTCCAAGMTKKLKDLARDLSLPADELLTEAVSSMGDWVLMTALTHTEAGALFAVAGSCEASGVSPWPWRITFCTEKDCLPDLQTADEREEKRKEAALPYLVQPYEHAAATKAATKFTATQLKGRSLDEELAEGTGASSQPLHFAKPRFGQARQQLSAAERGTAIHLAMQFIRYEACGDAEGVQKELERLCTQRFLTAQQAAAVDPEKILRFFRSDLGKEVRSGKKVIREFKFSVLEDGGLYDPALAGEEILLQGVTDCCIIEPEGLTILDFKSDRITPGMEAEKAEYYRGQINAYSRALSRIFSLPVKRRVLYFFATDSAFEL